MSPVRWLETYTWVIRQMSIDPRLHGADPWRFGVEPTVWLSKHSTPLLPRTPRQRFRIALVVEIAHGS